MVTVAEYTDRVYQNTPQEHIITNVVSGRKMRIQKYNFPDTGASSRIPLLPLKSTRNGSITILLHHFLEM